MEPFEIAANSDRLRDANAVVQFEHWNSTEGIFARNSNVLVSPLKVSTCSNGTVTPFSARKIRTRHGLGAILIS